MQPRYDFTFPLIPAIFHSEQGSQPIPWKDQGHVNNITTGKRLRARKSAYGPLGGGLLSLLLIICGGYRAHGQWSEGQIVYDPPAYGNFYSMKLGPDGPPLPWLPLYPTNMTVYALGTLNGVTAFAYDDRPRLNRGEDDPPTPDDPGEGEDPGVPLGRPVDIGTDLYLDIGPLTNHFAWLALTNTVSGKYYQLMSAAAVTNSP